MPTAYKLLRPDLTSYDKVPWIVGQWRETDGTGELCGRGWLHAYEHAELAYFLNPIHANYDPAVLYQVEGEGQSLCDHGLKIGYTRMRLMAPLDHPTPTTEQRVRFALACACAVHQEPTYIQWAQNWVSGLDRSATAAKAATRAADWSARAADWAAYGAARAARAASAAARAADWSASAASAASAAASASDGAADWSTRAADWSARAADWAAYGASRAARAASAAARAAELRRAANWAMTDSTALPDLMVRQP